MTDKDKKSQKLEKSEDDLIESEKDPKVKIKSQNSNKHKELFENIPDNRSYTSLPKILSNINEIPDFLAGLKKSILINKIDVNEFMSLLPALLGEQFLTWFEKENEIEDFFSFKLAIEQKFIYKSYSNVREKLESRKQLENEDFINFSLEIVQLCMYLKLPEDEIIYHLKKNSLAIIREKINVFPFKTSKDLIDYACSISENLKEVNLIKDKENNNEKELNEVNLTRKNYNSRGNNNYYNRNNNNRGRYRGNYNNSNNNNNYYYNDGNNYRGRGRGNFDIKKVMCFNCKG